MSNIIIGIGGTGGKVIRALRNRIQQTRGVEGDTNHYLCLDTMSYGYFLQEVYREVKVEELRETDTSSSMSDEGLRGLMQKLTGGETLAISESEYLQFKGLELPILDRILRNPNDENGQYSWLRAKDLKNTFGVSDKVFQFKEGAGQFRQIGRLGTYTTARDIDKRLRILERDSRANGVDGRSVYIICSLAGGTGSGNFFDVCALARNVFAGGRNQEGGQSDNINLLLLMDGAFGGDDELQGKGEDMQVITYATLRELGRFQSSPLPKLEMQFRYPHMDQITFDDQTLFNQVCLMDFDPAKVNEDFRQDTVYPAMAEMVDLLTAPGTGPKVGVGLVNVNKEIRHVQARYHVEENSANSDVKSAWAQDQFSHYFSSFSSFRVLFPKNAYLRRSAAEAIRLYLEALIGRTPKPLEQRHIEEACNFLKSRPSTANLFTSLFGTEVQPDAFRVPLSSDYDNPSAASTYLSKQENQSQLSAFMGRNEVNMMRNLDDQLSEFVRNNQIETLLSESSAHKDPNMSSDLFRMVDDVRYHQFGLRDLKELASRELNLSVESTTQKHLKSSVQNQIEAAHLQLREFINNELNKTNQCRDTLLVLKSIADDFLTTMIEQLQQRERTIINDRNNILSAVRRAQAAYTAIRRGGKECLNAAKAYIIEEQRMHRQNLRQLVNQAQLLLLEEIRKHAQQWCKTLERCIRDLVSDQPFSTFQLARRLESSIDKQLEEWAKSESVSLGMPSLAASNPKEMGPFLRNQILKGQLDQTLDATNNTKWILDPAKTELYLSYDEQRIEIDNRTYQTFQQLAEDQLAPSFKEWTFLRYFWESVCDRDKDKIDAAVQELVSKVEALEAGIRADYTKVHTKRYFICADPKDEFTEANDIIDAFKRLSAKVGISIEALYDTNAANEFSMVRMDSGLDEVNVAKLSASRSTYIQYIRQNSPILPLAHIFPEEQGLVARELVMHRKQAAGEARLIPNVLAPIFANEALAQLFLALYYTGFIFVPIENPENKSPNEYIAYLEFNRLLSLLKGKAEDRQDFSYNLEEEADKHFRYLYGLNPKVSGTGEADRPRRMALDKPELFSAMARFVQRLPNTIQNTSSEFALTTAQVDQLLDCYKTLWAGTNADGEQIYQGMSTYIEHWENSANELKLLDDREWESPDVLSDIIDKFHEEAEVYLHGAPLNKAESVEFLKQLSLFTEKYCKDVKPAARVKRRRL